LRIARLYLLGTALLDIFLVIGALYKCLVIIIIYYYLFI